MSFVKNLEARFARMQFGGKERLRIYRKLARFLKNNVSLTSALDTLWLHSSKDGKKPSMPAALAIDAWRKQVANGKSLGVAVRGWVPENDRIVLEAGEGNLVEALNNACLLYESQKQIKGALIAGVSYPIFLILIAMGFLVMFGLQVIPQFEQVLPRDKWSGVGWQMAVMSDFVRSYLIPSVAGAVLFIGAVIWSMPRWTGPLRVRAERFPPYSIYRLVAGSGFLLSMAALIRSGVKTTAALRLLQRDATPWYAERIGKTLAFVNNGLSLGDALQKTGLNFPDEDTVQDLRAYSSLEGFDEMLMKLGEENLDDTVKLIQNQTAILKNVGIVVLGGVFAWIAIGIFSLQQQITSNL